MIAKSVQSTRHGYRMRLHRSSTLRAMRQKIVLNISAQNSFTLPSDYLLIEEFIFVHRHVLKREFQSCRSFCLVKKCMGSFLGCVLHNLERFPDFFFAAAPHMHSHVSKWKREQTANQCSNSWENLCWFSRTHNKPEN